MRHVKVVHDLESMKNWHGRLEAADDAREELKVTVLPKQADQFKPIVLFRAKRYMSADKMTCAGCALYSGPTPSPSIPDWSRAGLHNLCVAVPCGQSTWVLHEGSQATHTTVRMLGWTEL